MSPLNCSASSSGVSLGQFAERPVPVPDIDLSIEDVVGLIGHVRSIPQAPFPHAVLAGLGVGLVQPVHVPNRLVQQPGHVRVMQGVDDLAAVAAADDHPEVPKDAQLVGDGRLSHADGPRQPADGARVPGAVGRGSGLGWRSRARPSCGRSARRS